MSDLAVRRGIFATSLAVGLSCSVVLAASAYAAGPVGLATLGRFGVIAGAGITNTGPTTITGDIGSFPITSETGLNSVTLSGADNAGNAVTQQAKNDLVTAYNDAAGRKPVTNVPTELGGTTLDAGVYTSPTLGMTGTLTLDAQGDPNAVFVFQAGTTLITAANSNVNLINGAVACNVVWQIGSSATFGTGTQFVGDVLAHDSITATTGATFQGRLLARDGAVTLDTNTITRPACAGALPVVTPTPTATPTSSTGSTPTGKPSTTPTPSATKSTAHPKASVSATNHSPGHSGTGSPNPKKPRHPGGFTDTNSTTPLPDTGAPTTQLVETALALMSIGGAAIFATRRRRPRGRHSA